MIVWINGAFGAGKTTTARELIELIPNSTLFDPEVIGGALTHLLPAKRLAEVGDFQDLPIWRRLVVDTAAAMLAELGGVLVVPMTLLRQEYRDEIFGGLAARRIPVRHVLLAPAETILRERIAGRAVPPDLPDGDLRVRQWSYDHIEPYRAALASWLTADAHPVDSSALTPYDTALRIADAVSTGDVPVCDIVQTPEPTAETVAAGCSSSTSRTGCCSSTRRTRPAGNSPAASSNPARPRARGHARGHRGDRHHPRRRARTPRRRLGIARAPGFGGLRLLFDGGRLDTAAAQRLLLPGPELRDWRFVTEREAADLLPPVRYERLCWALRARERGAALYLEAGVPVG